MASFTKTKTLGADLLATRLIGNGSFSQLKENGSLLKREIGFIDTLLF